MQRLTLNSRQFLKHDWQQQPRLFRQAFADNSDLLSPEMLAGLALEDGVDARIVQYLRHQDSWQVSHGPFSDYEAFGEQDWTLLVQSVNEWLPEVQQLLQQFRFLPDWRLDDVMISFACEGGGVGPHLDQYDVFIIQGQGRRRWRVGARGDYQQHRPHPDLLQLSGSFQPIIDEVLEAGDMLYIPAGCPHDGVALEPCLNYSVGFRAPNQAEALASLSDIALADDRLATRYQDPAQDDHGQPWQIQPQALDQLQRWLKQALDSDDMPALLAAMLSQSKRPLPTPEQQLTPSQVAQLLRQAETSAQPAWLCRTPGARLLQDPQQRFWFNGEALAVPAAAHSLATELAAQWDDMSLTDFRALADDQDCCALLAELLNQGGWYIELEAN
ncbi:cupin domain-containing protein [Idiomarina xiamenensis]|uniref:Cupin n=1 Tax=Idiomarina xiamenensis 10-D-4 TaxID=740709 RepID=K2KG45_9GAMM|nr:cupin domain-containing protein [Idiomarina xiamenensis]EKE86983.1 cupin [Idiomarina xiamenensis 10-D-4]